MTQGFFIIRLGQIFFSKSLQPTELLCENCKKKRLYADFFFRVWPVHFFLSIIINISLYWRPQKTKRQGNSHYHQKIAKPSILRGYSVSPNIAQSPQKNFSTLLHCSGLAIMMHCLPCRTVFSSSKTSFKGFSSRHISHQKNQWQNMHFGLSQFSRFCGDFNAR